MKLLDTAFYTGFATIIKLGAGFLLQKVIAMQVGPSGLAYFGQFQSFITMVMQLASGAVNNGVIKYTAELEFDSARKRRLFTTAFYICFLTSIPIGAILIFSAEKLSEIIFKNFEYTFIFQLFGLSLVLFVLNHFLLAILNGQKDLKAYTAVNITSSIVGLIMTTILVVVYQIKGALVALATNQSLVFLVAIWIAQRRKWFDLSLFCADFDWVYFKKLLKFASMAMVTAIAVPATQLFLRNYAGDLLGWIQVGYWEGMIKISSAYLSLITMTLSVYYLPKLSSLQSGAELKQEILNGYKVIIPFVVLISGIIFVGREQVIKILFTSDFLPMAELFAIQLVGDVLKISSWILASLMLAKAMTRLFILTEIFFSLNLLGLSIYLIHVNGIVGLVQAYMINYALYFIFNIIYFRILLFYGIDNKSKDS